MSNINHEEDIDLYSLLSEISEEEVKQSIHSLKEQERLKNLHSLSDDNIDEVFESIIQYSEEEDEELIKYIHIGNTYNRYKVISKENTDSSGHVLYRCICIKCNKESLCRAYEIYEKRYKYCRFCTKPTIGMQYYNWTILSEAGKDKGNNLLYKCQCTCGNIYDVRFTRIRIGKSTQCKICATKKNRNAEKHRDIKVGQVFGSRTIISKEYISKNNHIYVLTQCICGKESYCLYYGLINGHADKCLKCSTTKHSIGDKVGSREIIDIQYSSQTNSRRSKVTYKCDCGYSATVNIVNFSKLKCRKCSHQETINLSKLTSYKTVGTVIGRWKVLSFKSGQGTKTKKTACYYEIQCSCGFISHQRRGRIEKKKCPQCEQGQGIKKINL